MKHRDNRILSLTIAILLQLLVAACAGENAVIPEDEEQAALIEEGLETLEADAAVLANGCSIVQWCDAPGADGSICQQTGCGRSSAIAECRAEVASICGTPTCPLIFKSPGGSRTNLCNCSGCN